MAATELRAALQEALRSLDWRQFEDVFERYLESTGQFRRIERAAVVAGGSGVRRRVDFICTVAATPALGEELWAFELVAGQRPVDKLKVLTVDGQLHDAIPMGSRFHRRVLACTQYLTTEAGTYARHQGLDVWDGERLAELFPDPLAIDIIKGHIGERPMVRGTPVPRPTEAALLLQRLGDIKPGQDQWVAYQEWSADALRYLFSPPLGTPDIEVVDASRRDRRDIIMENAAPDQFWGQMRLVYDAHYVVADAKNYAKPLTKRPVLELAHYLKPYGLGLFGMLVCRAGAGVSARHAIREQWIASRKLILALSDEDMTTMIGLRDTNRGPESHLREAIRAFRISL